MAEQPTGGATGAEGRELAEAVRTLVEWAHATAGWRPNEVSALVQDFLGGAGAEQSVVTRELPAFEHVNLQTALDAWSARARPDGRGARHRHAAALRRPYAAAAGHRRGRCRRCGCRRPALVDLPNGPGSTLGLPAAGAAAGHRRRRAATSCWCRARASTSQASGRGGRAAGRARPGRARRAGRAALPSSTSTAASCWT